MGADIRLCTKNQLLYNAEYYFNNIKNLPEIEKEMPPKVFLSKLLGRFILERFSVIDLLVIGRNTTKGCRL